MSISTSSSGSDGKNGEEWKSKVFFDPIADAISDEKGPLELRNDQLLKEMTRLIDKNEKIIKIYAFKCPLSSLQLTQLVFYHQFIVFQTECWWWSIEKNSEGITVQRARKLDSVKDRYRRTPRNSPINVIVGEKGQGTMKDVIQWLHSQRELYKKYCWTSENCKHFANRLFNNFAETKNL